MLALGRAQAAAGQKVRAMWAGVQPLAVLGFDPLEWVDLPKLPANLVVRQTSRLAAV